MHYFAVPLILKPINLDGRPRWIFELLPLCFNTSISYTWSSRAQKDIAHRRTTELWIGTYVRNLHARRPYFEIPSFYRCQRVLQSYDQIIPNGQSLANLVDGDQRTDHAAFFQTPLENCRTLLPKTRFAWQHGEKWNK